jgi:hypothetical protein
MGHCVGGYCPDVLEGRSRIFSLRNKKTGEPHVTIETSPSSSNPLKALREGTATDFDIVQIKGKANKAPKEDYLPAVQDFVRSGNFGKVGDLGNAGLADITKYDDRLKQAAQEAYGSSRFLTNQEMDALMKSQRDAGFAEGGLVGHTEYSPLEVDYIIDNVRSGQHEGGLAPYGLRHSGEGAKGKGYYGALPNKAGGVSTELSAEDDDLGEYPLMVPNLSADELKSLLANEAPSSGIYDKARSHAQMRKAAGRSAFIESGELRRPKPERFAEGGLVEYDPAKISSLVNALREELNA